MSSPPAAPSPRTPSLPFPLQPDERVLTVCRRHWLYVWPRLIIFALAGLLPVIVLAILLSKSGGFDRIGTKAFWIVALIYLAFWALRAFLAWYIYQHDIWVITSQRIVDSSKHSPFNLRVSSADLVNVQDMTVERNGIFETMLDYGDVICQTSADVQEFRITGVAHPREIQALVDRERDRERQRAHQG